MFKQLLTDEDCVLLLKLRLNNPNIVFDKYETDSLKENLEGFLGDHYILKIKYFLNDVEDVVKFFVKSKPQTEEHSSMASELLIYEKEIFFYSYLVKEYNKRGYNTDFAPRMYLSKNNELLVMEDLKSEGYFLSGRNNFFDFSKSKAALKALAIYHGASFILEEEKSLELNREYRLGKEFPKIFVEKFLNFKDKSSISYTFFHTSIQCFIKLIDVLNEPKDWKEDFKNRLKTTDYHSMFTCELGFRKACGHGDLWANNMLFKQHKGETICRIIDYQILRYFNPAFDVLYLLYVNTRKAFRDKYMKNLLNYYFEQLQKILSSKGFSVDLIYSFEDYLKSIEHYKIITRIDTACSHTLTFLDTSKLNQILGDRSMEEVMLEDRPSLVLESYFHDEFFKEIINEHLYEIRNMLIKV